MRLFRTRLHAYVSLVLLACVLIAGIVILLLPRERVTRANFEKIRVDMSRADVERLLGPAAETRPSGKTLFEEGDQDCTLRRWSSQKMTIIVITDTAGRVVYPFESGDSLLNERSFWEEVRYWIMKCF